jgi:membrane protein YdbS with pleckstrin-like domain
LASVRRTAERPAGPSRGLWHEFLISVVIPDYDNVILPGEIIRFYEHRHLVWWLRETWGAFVLLFVGTVVLYYTDEPLVANVTFVFELFALLYILWKLAEWAVLVLVVTDRRLIEVGGVFSLNIGVLPLAKLTDLKYEQPLLGRLFGYGAVRVETAGQDQALSRISYVRLPILFFRAISRPPAENPFDD